MLCPYAKYFVFRVCMTLLIKANGKVQKQLPGGVL